MKRRDALKNMGASFGALTVTPTVISLFQSCQSTPAYAPVAFSSEQFQVVSELMEIIIPETDIPGAKSLKLAEFTDAYVDAVVDDKGQKDMFDAMEAFISDALSDTGKASADQLTVADWDGQLAKYLNADEPVEGPAAAFANQLRSMTVRAFKVSEYIGENVLAYAPIPGEQRGCVDLMETTGGMAWSL